jgi:hypothetical protein
VRERGPVQVVRFWGRVPRLLRLMRYTDAIKVKASLLDDGVVDTLGLVGAMSGVHTSDDGESTSAVRVVATSVCGADQPPLGGQHELGPRQRPLQPLRAAHNLKPPAHRGILILRPSQAANIQARAATLSIGGRRTRESSNGTKEEQPENDRSLEG